MKILNRCPHCRTVALARSSRELNPTFREITCMCTNQACGHTYVVNMEFARTLSPSAMPNLSLRLPLTDHIRERLREQLDAYP